MLLYLRLRPFVLLPALTDDVCATAKALPTPEDDEHLLEDAVAADRMATFEELFYSNEHGAGVGEVEMVWITLDDDAFQHPPLAVDKAVADGFTQRFVGGSLIQAAVTLKFEYDGYGVVKLFQNTGVKLEEVGNPGAVRIETIGVSDTRVCRHFLSVINEVVRSRVMDGFFRTEHQDTGQREAALSCFTVFAPNLYLPEEFHIVESIPSMTGLAKLEQLTVLVDGGLVEILLQAVIL